MIDKKLIEKSLALCGREYSDMGIEHYCYFLLSPSFIEKYYPIWIKDDSISDDYKFRIAQLAGESIYEYQLGNEAPLVKLLTKI